MNTSIRSLTLAFTFAAASVLSASTAGAQIVIDHLPYKIVSNGNYVLNSNLNSSQTTGNLIEIDASNVTIDFQNHYIAGPVNNTTQTTNGIYANEQSNLTIKNGTIAYCQQGINIVGNGSTSTNSVDQVIDNMRITYCYLTGIYVNQSPASRVTNCQVSQIGLSTAATAYGILTFGTNGTVTVADNIVDHVFGSTTYGIFVADNNSVRRNAVSNCLYGVRGGQYQDNLFYGVVNGFTSGVDAGGNFSR